MRTLIRELSVGLLLFLTAVTGARSQNTAVDPSGKAYFIQPTIFPSGTSPAAIEAPVLQCFPGGGFRLYSDIRNTGTREITGLRLWLLVYFRSGGKPVLFTFDEDEPLPPGESRYFYRDERSADYGDPVDAIIAPHTVRVSGAPPWRLSSRFLLEERSPSVGPPPGSGVPVKPPRTDTGGGDRCTHYADRRPAVDKPVIDGGQADRCTGVSHP